MRLTITATLFVLLSTAAYAQDAGCLQPDEGKLTNHGCYLNHDHESTHRPTTTDANVQPVDASAR
jgi:hypothetical protein